ncbi:hypothetical protein BZA77DRAFT_298667 [Pyronema omphalodes]|nr:hypothetical protein BZA77DRAFT_298667 [Pyronema omphalodes]
MATKTAFSLEDTPESSGVHTPTSNISEPSSPVLFDNCTSDPPLDASESSSGEVVKLGDTEVYISKPADNTDAKLLLLLTNGVGVHSVNNQVQADHFARIGYFVAMPDLGVGGKANAGV